MPIAKYEFNLEFGHDDIYRHNIFSNAEHYYRALMDISEYLDRKCRGEYEKPPPNWEVLRRVFLDLLDDNSLKRSDF